MSDRYYLAYGSNLSVRDMKYRTPDAEIVGTAVLKGWRLLFREFATIKKDANFDTPVLVWKISKRDEKNLDCYEGFPRFYIKKNLKVAVTSLDGDDLGELTAMAYIMTHEAVNARKINPEPSYFYFSVLLEGYEAFKFDKKILTQALEESVKLMPETESRIIHPDNQPTTA